MKKLLSLLILVSILTFASQASATSNTHKVSLTISKITYSSADHTYYAYTQKEADGGFWVVDITPNGLTLKQIKKLYIGHTIDIYYTGNEQTDEEFEIVKTVIH